MGVKTASSSWGNTAFSQRSPAEKPRERSNSLSLSLSLSLSSSIVHTSRDSILVFVHHIFSLSSLYFYAPFLAPRSAVEAIIFDLIETSPSFVIDLPLIFRTHLLSSFPLHFRIAVSLSFFLRTPRLPADYFPFVSSPSLSLYSLSNKNTRTSSLY